MRFELASDCAVVTGSGPGINAGIALALAEAGAAVACLDIEESYALRCAEWLTHQGHKAIGVQCDVTDQRSAAAAIMDVRERLGVPGILINGAALHRPEGVLDGSVEVFKLHLDTILLGAYVMTHEVSIALVRAGQRGAIVNVLSTEAHQGNPISSGYGAAKSGLWGLTRSSAMELAKYDIRVNSVTPTGTDPVPAMQRAREWGVDWRLSPRTQVPQEFSRGGNGIPLGRRPEAEDYGNAVTFLCSDGARMMTGTDVRVDGGALARYWRWNPEAEG